MTHAALAVAAAGEAFTGLALLLAPSAVVRLLFGSEAQAGGVIMGRIAGIALVALGIACWPGAREAGSSRAAYGAMLAYSVLAGAYLAGLGWQGQAAGVLLWPAVVAHVVLAVALGWTWSKTRTPAR